jgi:hypothetical protein
MRRLRRLVESKPSACGYDVVFAANIERERDDRGDGY